MDPHSHSPTLWASHPAPRWARNEPILSLPHLTSASLARTHLLILPKTLHWSCTQKPPSPTGCTLLAQEVLVSGCLTTDLPLCLQDFDLSGGFRNCLFQLILRLFFFFLSQAIKKNKGHNQSKVSQMQVESLGDEMEYACVLTLSVATILGACWAVSFLASGTKYNR